MEKKLAKKIVALTSGALMLGATLTGALAVADLADYPAPYVKSGVLSDTVIVVGKAAQTADVLGAVDIAASLQAAAVSKTTVVGTTSAPTVDAGVKIEKSGDKLNYNETVYQVQATALDENDLDFLSEGTYEDNEGTNKQDEDYDQDLWFGNTDNNLYHAFTQVSDNDNYPDGKSAGDYLYIQKNRWVYNYTLEFDSTVAVANAADLEGTSIQIQGNTYTITEATVASNIPTKLTLVAGDSTVWLVQDQPYTVGSHTVTVVDVDSGETKCGVNVDGVTVWIDDGSTHAFGELSVGVLDVVAVYTKDCDADTCELSLGSNEIILENAEEVVVNGEKLDGSMVTLAGTSGTGWNSLLVKYKLGDDGGLNQDDVYLSEGESWSDPVFGNFKVIYEGVTADYEMMEFKAGSDDATFTFTNNDGQEVEIPYHYTGSAMMLGTDTDEELLLPGEISTSSNPEGTMLLYTTSGGETHVLEIDDLTCGSSTNKTTIKDVTYKTTVAKDVALSADCQGSFETISLGSLGSISLNFTSTKVRYASSATLGAGTPESMYEGTFTFNDTAVKFTEKAGDEMGVATVTFDLTYDTTDSEIDVATPRGFDFGAFDEDESNSDDQWYVTRKGTKAKYDAENKRKVEIWAPEEDVFGNVFVAPLSASVVSGGSSGGTADKVNPFTVGLAVLDTDAKSMSKNMLVVGGPCANTVAAEVMGNPENCAE
jgi:hypothetical protein